MKDWVIGVIGGSGLYDLDGLTDRRALKLDSPWGAPSDVLVTGEMEGVRLVFLPRHGQGHRLPPTDINARANIDVLKRAGCTDLISVSAVGSLREELPPGTFVVVDQFIDRTVARPSSFFGPGLVAHVSLADPVCPVLSGAAAAAARAAGASTVEGGTYVAIEGPQFFDPGRKRVVPQLGLFGDRHDGHARGPAGPRGGAALRQRLHGHRL